MKKYAKVENDETKQVSVGIGTDTKFYESIGMTEMDVEQAFDGTWYVAGYAPLPSLENLKSAKLAEINVAYDKVVSGVVATYPDMELLTFDKQEKEARQWKADSSAATPFLDGLAKARGIDKDELVDRVIAKADAFQTAVATLTGLRQKYEDQLALAQTAEDIAAIVPEYSV